MITSSMNTVIVRYRLRLDARDAFVELLTGHWPTLRRLGLVTDRPVECYEGIDAADNQPVVIEIFEWVSADAAQSAHVHPEVSPIWEAMGPLMRDGEDRPQRYNVTPLVM